jgi:hypothetical protein
LAALVGPPASARAETVLGIEPRASLVIADPPRFGPELGLTVGYSPDLYPLLLVPELELDGAIYPGTPLFGIGRVLAGMRVGVTASVEPAAYFHVGYGFADTEGALDHGFAVDAGAALDGRISRTLTVGGTLGYQGLVAGDASAHGLTAGLRIGIWL